MSKNTKPSKKSPPQKLHRNHPRRYWIYGTGCIVVALLIIISYGLFAPYFGGQIRFYRAWQDCGSKPYQGHYHIEGEVDYYSSTLTVKLLRRNNIPYFCTEKEAELGGFSASADSYSFPHLNHEEWKRATGS